jgi:16S rRNA processing protein RimM
VADVQKPEAQKPGAQKPEAQKPEAQKAEALSERMVARLGRAHGLRGEISAELHTDVPQERFRPGAVFDTDPAGSGPLTLERAREYQDGILLNFQGVLDRAAAERLRGTRLMVRTTRSDEPDAWYPEELVGLAARTPQGRPLGQVAALEPSPAQDLLVVRTEGGAEVLVPFVAALVPVVDLVAGEVVIDPPGGLFDDLPEELPDEAPR